ncbi:MAG: threonine--tRNA ligase [Deltaproteobacteria bacterium]|nr:threonine--tRNA ligase [Deltaproteobacteria bacterium]
MSIQITLPDGAQRELADNATAADLAMNISPRLADVVVVAKVDGQVQDLRVKLKTGQKVELLKIDTPEGRDTLNHSAEHILATAVCRVFPGVKVTMGPKTHSDEFYYDFDAGRSFGPDDLEKIEAEMRKIIEAKTPFELREVTKAEAVTIFNEKGQNNEYKQEILSWIPEDNVTLYTNAEFVDLCRGPHLPHAGFIKGLKLMTASGAYWRADATKAPLQRVKGIAFPKKEELDKHLHRIDEAKKRDHRKIGKELELFLVSERYDDHSYTESEEIDLYVGVEADAPTDGRIVERVLAAARENFPGRKIRQTVKLAPAPAPATADVDIRVRGQMTPEQRKAVEGFLIVDGPETGTAVKLNVSVEPHYSEEVGPGLVMWLPKGGRLRTIIEEQWRKMHFEGGYEIVYSPHLAKADLWKVSGHWDFYREGMFSPMSVDGHDYVCKPMNCPFHCLMVKSRARSYREFPMRLAELGTVYRYELAGVMHGLMRVRGFTQDDAHLFCRWDQVEVEIDRVIAFILRVLKTFGFKNFEVNLSTRPEKYVGKLDDWAKAEAYLEAAIKRVGLPYQVDVGGGAFYGPKIDIKLTDCLDRKWQCSTLQLDFNNPERFNLEFVNAKGEKEQPVMLHRALLGSVERFIGILVEEYAGAFPAWLSPEQVRVITVSDKHNEHGQKTADALLAAGLRATFEASSDKLGAKIRNAQLEKVPLMLVVGDKEVEGGGATVRMRDGADKGFMANEALIAFLKEQCVVPVVV